MAVDVTILKVDNPWCFWLKEAPGPMMSSETKLFQELNERIQDHCSAQLHISKYLLQPRKGQICLARRSADKQWYRAKILTIMHSTQGPQASLHLLDFAENIRSPTSLLRELPSEFQQVPFQVKEARLYKTQPITLETCYVSFKVKPVPCIVWDNSATVFFKNAVKEATSSKVKVHHRDSSANIFYVTLYLNMPLEGLVDINEYLVMKEYAINNEVGLSPSKNVESSTINAFNKKVDVEAYLKLQVEKHEEAAIHDEENPITNVGVSTKNEEQRRNVKKLEKLESLKEDEMKRAFHQKSSGNVLEQSWGIPDDEAMSRSSEDRWSETEATTEKRKQQAIGRGKLIANMLSRLDGNKVGSWGVNTDELEPVMISRRRNRPVESFSISSPPDLRESSPFGTISAPWSRKFPSKSSKKDQESSSDSSLLFNPSQKLLENVGTPEALSKKELRKKMLEMLEALDSEDSESDEAPVHPPKKRPVSMAKMLKAAVSSSSISSKESDSSEVPSPDTYRRKRYNVLELLEKSPDGQEPPGVMDSRLSDLSPERQRSKDIDDSLLLQHSLVRVGQDVVEMPQPPCQLSQDMVSQSPDGHQNQSLNGSSDCSKHVHWKPDLVKDEAEREHMMTISHNLVGILKTPSPDSTRSMQFEERVKKHDSDTPTKTGSLSKELDKKFIQERLSSQLLGDILPIEDQHLTEDITLVHGDRPLRPIVELDQAPFPDMFKKMLKKKNFYSPILIESHSWPTILRGRDMVGVSKESRNLAYLLPLFTQVVQLSAYSALAKGNGPLIIVIVPRWKKAKQVYDDALSLLPNSNHIRALIVHGAGAEENKEIDLINGCEILIATPLCFLRLLKKSHLNTDRLCHLVFDDADMVFSEFTQEVREIMQVYGKTLLSQLNRSAPRQIMAFSAHWTAGIESFMKAYLSDPLVIITRKLESAVYGKVWHVVHLCRTSHKYNKILDLLDTAHAQSTGRRVVVFTQYKEDALNLHHMLLSSSHYALVIHNDMNADEVELARHEWRANHQQDSMPVLVVTDDAEFTLTNATWVVHFDFPTSRITFGNRLGFCRDNYVNQLKQVSIKNINKLQCLSHMLIGEDDYEHVSGFAQFMRRTCQKLTSKVDLEKAKQAKEERKKTKKLCKRLKAYGKCCEEHCHFRHHLYAELDSPVMLDDQTTLPVSGYVKVLISYIVDATHYFARVLSSQKDLASDETLMDSGATVKLSSDMQIWFEDPRHRVKHSDAKCGDMCVIEDSRHTFHRARVEMLFAQHDMKNATVQLVDNGRFEVVNTDKLLSLPAHLYHIPLQVVEVFLCQLKPKDQDTDWTNQASAFVHNMTYHKELCGRVVLSLGNTLWLDPLVERVQLSAIKTVVNEHNVRLELLRAGYADHNTEHMKLLKECCKGRIDICPPSDKEEEEKETHKVMTKMMQLSERFVNEVYLSAIDTPDLIYVQRLDKYKRLEALMKEINERMENSVRHYDSLDKSVDGGGDSTSAEGGMTVESKAGSGRWNVGSYCLAKFPFDAMWYRGRIVEQLNADQLNAEQLNAEENVYTVFFLDYGDQEDIGEGEIYPIWDDALQLPFQAINCRLTGVLPTEDNWTQEVGNALWDICNENEHKQVLDAKVKSKGFCKVTSAECYEVELSFNAATPSSLSCTSCDLSVNLALQGLALPSDATLQNMFPTSDVADSVSAICKTYYQTKDDDERLYLARNISNITSNRKESDTSYEPHDVRSLCYIFSIASDPGEKHLLIEAIIKASYGNFRNCDEISEHGCLKQVCALLNESSDNDILEQVLWILKVASITKRVRDNLSKLDVIDALCRLLSSNSHPPVVTNCCLALSKLLSEHPVNQELVKQAGGLKVLCDLLKRSKEDMNVCQTVLGVLSHLGSNSRYRDDIREMGGLEVMCDLLWNVEDEEVLSLSAQTLKFLGNANPANLTAMINEGMLDSIESLLLSPSLSEMTTHTLSDLDLQLLEFSMMNKAKIELMKRADIEGVDINAVKTTIVQSPSREDDQQGASKHAANNKDNGMSAKYPGYNAVMSPHYATNGCEVDDLDLSDLPPLEVVDTIKRTHPKVLWSQKANSILLSVQLRGVKENEVVVTNQTLSFSTIMDIICYKFYLELFGNVLTSNHVVVITGSEVLITLFKQNENVRWPRLTKSKSKLTFVGVDFERWQDDSSSSDEVRREKFAKHSTKPKTKVNKSISSKPPTVVLPEFDTSSEGIDESSSNSEDHFHF